MSLVTLENPRNRPVPKGIALFALGFRPFYLLAVYFSLVAIPAWVMIIQGNLLARGIGVHWHAHEMIFGFVAAIIVGFLFTAGKNWTGLPTPIGVPLAGLASLWVAGRVVMALVGTLPPLVIGLIDGAFLPAAAIALARVLVKASSRRNYFTIVILSALALANLTFHLALSGIISIEPTQPLLFAIGVITMLETAIGGRIIPLFTANALRGLWQWQHPRLNQAAIAATGVALLLWVSGGGIATAVVALVAGILQGVRTIGWNPWATRKTPIVWILHLGHLWIPVGLFLIAGVELFQIPRSAAVHAFTIGATGGLIIGMITRTALGHTGRMLKAGKLETAAYTLVMLAAGARVLILIALQSANLHGIHLAGTCWVIAFVLYLYRYTPYLVQPRVDGKEG